MMRSWWGSTFKGLLFALTLNGCNADTPDSKNLLESLNRFWVLNRHVQVANCSSGSRDNALDEMHYELKVELPIINVTEVRPEGTYSYTCTVKSISDEMMTTDLQVAPSHFLYGSCGGDFSRMPYGSRYYYLALTNSDGVSPNLDYSIGCGAIGVGFSDTGGIDLVFGDKPFKGVFVDDGFTAGN